MSMLLRICAHGSAVYVLQLAGFRIVGLLPLANNALHCTSSSLWRSTRWSQGKNRHNKSYAFSESRNRQTGHKHPHKTITITTRACTPRVNPYGCIEVRDCISMWYQTIGRWSEARHCTYSISLEVHKQCFITRREMTSGTAKPPTSLTVWVNSCKKCLSLLLPLNFLPSFIRRLTSSLRERHTGKKSLSM